MIFDMKSLISGGGKVPSAIGKRVLDQPGSKAIPS
jgi:hypothetical protein